MADENEVQQPEQKPEPKAEAKQSYSIPKTHKERFELFKKLEPLIQDGLNKISVGQNPDA